MSLKLTIENGIKDAMRAKDADRLRALRGIKSLILLEETSGSSTDGLSADAEMKKDIRVSNSKIFPFLISFFLDMHKTPGF